MARKRAASSEQSSSSHSSSSGGGGAIATTESSSSSSRDAPHVISSLLTADEEFQQIAYHMHPLYAADVAEISTLTAPAPLQLYMDACQKYHIEYDPAVVVALKVPSARLLRPRLY